MKQLRHIRTARGPAIVIASFFLGFVLSPLFLAKKVPLESERSFLAITLLGAAEIAEVAVIALGLFVLVPRIRRRQELERDLLEAFLEHIPDNVFFKDRQSRFMRISRAMANYCGLSDPAKAVNQTDSDIFTSEHADQALADEQRIIRTGQPMIGKEEKETWPDGHETWVLTTKVPLRDKQGQIIGTMGIAHDITDRKRAEMRIEYMATHDTLTGLPNRLLLEDRLGRAIALASRQQSSVGIFKLGLDRFKNVNDSFGHFVGDRLLEAVSVRLKACLRESDIVARPGGDEFVVCLQLVERNEDVETVAKRVLAAFAEPFQIEGQELAMSATMGVSRFPGDGENPVALLQFADAAMYEAKKRVRGTHRLFTPALTEATRLRQRLEVDLRHACSRDEFVLYYQPIVSIQSGRVAGVEALLRWQHPERGVISPSQFLPQLEEMGFLVDIGRWVLRTACRQNAAWQLEGLPQVRVAVNVSPQQFYQGNVVDTVSTILNEVELGPQWLELELTESQTLDDSEATINIMKDLKKLGVSLSIDDFGTGWSSLSYLRRFPVDRLKIDRSFVRDLTSQPAAEAVVKSILSLGHGLGLSCIAEGVELPRQRDALKRLSCAEMQGYLFSPPVPAVDCAFLLRSAGRLTTSHESVTQSALG